MLKTAPLNFALWQKGKRKEREMKIEYFKALEFLENGEMVKRFDPIFAKDIIFAILSPAFLAWGLYPMLSIHSFGCGAALLFHNLIMVDWR